MMRSVRQAGGWGLAILVVLLAGGSGCAKNEGGAPGGRGGSGGRGGFAMPPTPVETARVVRAPMEDRFTTIGSFEADEAITVVSEIDGVIVDVPFAEGRAVARGGMIARLDDAQLRAELQRAEALRDQARTAHERIRQVVEAKAASAQDLDDAAAALKVAEANVDLARTRLAKTRIQAPFGGVTGARRVSPGAFVRSGDAITDLARISDLRVNFSVPERLLPFVTPGAPVGVRSSAWEGFEAEGKVSVVEPVLDPATRTARVVAAMKNPEGRFRPGMSAAIAIRLSARAEALSVPNEAVVVEGTDAFVYRVGPDSTVARAVVTLGVRLADAVEITSGVEEGDLVVRAGHQKLYPGARVAPLESRRPSDPAAARPASAAAAPDGGGR